MEKIVSAPAVGSLVMFLGAVYQHMDVVVEPSDVCLYVKRLIEGRVRVVDRGHLVFVPRLNKVLAVTTTHFYHRDDGLYVVNHAASAR